MSDKITRLPKIAYIATPISFGGAERVSLHFLQHVDRDKFEIEPILFLRPWEPDNIFATELSYLGYRYFAIPVAKSRRDNVFRIIRCLRNLYQIVMSNSYDVIHTHGYLADLLGFLISRIAQIPIISTCHGFISGDVKLSLYNNLDLCVLRYFNRVIAVSDSIRLDLVKHNVGNNKISIIENTTPVIVPDFDTDARKENKRKSLNVQSTDLLLGYFGRLSKEKGIIFLLESIRMLDSLPLPVTLVIVGDGPQREELQAVVRSNGLADRVIFAGFQQDIRYWLTAIDVFVLPSMSEGTPMALLEAMSFGVPCIASAVGGIPRIIDSGVDGILVSPGRPDEIRDAIYLLSTDTLKRKSISENAQNKITQKYDIKNWARKIEEEYTNIIASNRQYSRQ